MDPFPDKITLKGNKLADTLSRVTHRLGVVLEVEKRFVEHGFRVVQVLVHVYIQERRRHQTAHVRSTGGDTALMQTGETLAEAAHRVRP